MKDKSKTIEQRLLIVPIANLEEKKRYILRRINEDIVKNDCSFEGLKKYVEMLDVI